MRAILFFFLSLTFIASSSGQVRFGAGATYLSNNNKLFGVHARVLIPGLIENGSLLPQFTYFIEDGSTVISGEINLMYTLVEIGDEMPIYAFAGPDWTRKATGDNVNSYIGFNIGLGTIISGKVYVEPRMLVLTKGNEGTALGANVGYYF